MASLQVTPATPFYQQGTPDLSGAIASGSLGVGFSGSGFLVIWFVGVASILKQLGVINSSTKLAGTSGGSITSAALCSGMPPHQMFAANMAMAQRCRAKDACKGFLASAVRDSMAAALPANAAQSCAGRLWTTATQAKPHHQRDTGVLVGPNWSSNGQILDAVVASSFIPGMSGGLVTDALKAEGIPAAYDGGFTNMIPTPPGASAYIHIAAHVPRSDAAEAASSYLELGVLRATADSADKAAAAAYLPFNPVRIPSPTPDIFPGLSGPLKVSAQKWASFAANIPDDETLTYIFNTGRADAAAFVRAKGLASAAAVDAALAATTPQALLGGGGAAAGVTAEAGSKGHRKLLLAAAAAS